MDLGWGKCSLGRGNSSLGQGNSSLGWGNSSVGWGNSSGGPVPENRVDVVWLVASFWGPFVYVANACAVLFLHASLETTSG